MLKATYAESKTLDQTNSLKEFQIDYDGETAIFDKECENFMKGFVRDVFSPSCMITQEKKSEFGLLCQHSSARLWFSKFIDSKRSDFKEVQEITFFRLIQYFAIVLFECSVSDDFLPATTLLNMAFTYYHISDFKESGFRESQIDSPKRQYLYHFLKDQQIWKSIRFWTSSFLFAVDGERKKRPHRGSWRSLNEEEKKEFNLNEEYSAFGHLGTFLYTMKAFDLESSLIEEFLAKMGTIENLSTDQLEELTNSVEVFD